MSNYIQILSECQAQDLGLTRGEPFSRDRKVLAEWQAQAMGLVSETPFGIEPKTAKTNKRRTHNAKTSKKRGNPQRFKGGNTR